MMQQRAGATPKRGEDPMVTAAAALIVKGKEQGFISPDDILVAFRGARLTPDELFRISTVFGEMGIEVSDGEKEVEEAIDEDVEAEAQAADSLDPDDLVRMY